VSLLVTSYLLLQEEEEEENLTYVKTTIFCYGDSIGKCKAMPVTGRGRPQGCETSRLPHFLDIWLTDGFGVVSLTRRPTFIPRKIPVTHFC
jgi:hypothetical protein